MDMVALRNYKVRGVGERQSFPTSAPRRKTIRHLKRDSGKTERGNNILQKREENQETPNTPNHNQLMKVKEGMM